MPDPDMLDKQSHANHDGSKDPDVDTQDMQRLGKEPQLNVRTA